MQSKTYGIEQDGTTILSITITAPDDTTYEDIEWDSKTGLVTAIVNGKGKRVPIPYEGNGLGFIQPRPFKGINTIDIKHHFWYY